MASYREGSAQHQWMTPLTSDSLRVRRPSERADKHAPPATGGFTPNEPLPGEPEPPARPLMVAFPLASSPDEREVAPSHAAQPPAMPAFRPASAPASPTMGAGMPPPVTTAAPALAPVDPPVRASRVIERDMSAPSVDAFFQDESVAHARQAAPAQPEAPDLRDAAVPATRAETREDRLAADHVAAAISTSDDPDDDPDEGLSDAVPTADMPSPAPVPLSQLASPQPKRRVWPLALLTALVLLIAAALALWQTGVLGGWLGQRLPTPGEAWQSLKQFALRK